MGLYAGRKSRSGTDGLTRRFVVLHPIGSRDEEMVTRLQIQQPHGVNFVIVLPN